MIMDYHLEQINAERLIRNELTALQEQYAVLIQGNLEKPKNRDFKLFVKKVLLLFPQMGGTPFRYQITVQMIYLQEWNVSC